MASWRSLPCHLSDSPMWMRIRVRSPSNFSWVIDFLVRIQERFLPTGSESSIAGRWSGLKAISEANSGDTQKQAWDYACSHIGRGPGPLAGFEHFGGFPTEAGEGCVTAEEADGDGHAPIRRDYHAIERELADQSQEEAAGQVN